MTPILLITILSFNHTIITKDSIAYQKSIPNASPLKIKKTKLTASSISTIAGATLFYNLNGGNPENLIGSANIAINSAPKFVKNFRLNIISNITKVTSELNKEDFKSDLIKLTQSNQGLSIGIEPVVFFDLSDKMKKDRITKAWVAEHLITPRIYGSLNYKLNTFTNVAIGADTTTVNLDQGRFIVGVEAEGIEFDTGNYLYLGAEIGFSVFDKNSFYKIFKENRNTLWGSEITVGVPLFSKLKLLLKHTWSQGTKSVFSTGIIFIGGSKLAE